MQKERMASDDGNKKQFKNITVNSIFNNAGKEMLYTTDDAI
jgi:hypothetical protein